MICVFVQLASQAGRHCIKGILMVLLFSLFVPTYVFVFIYRVFSLCIMLLL